MADVSNVFIFTVTANVALSTGVEFETISLWSFWFMMRLIGVLLHTTLNKKRASFSSNVLELLNNYSLACFCLQLAQSDGNSQHSDSGTCNQRYYTI